MKQLITLFAMLSASTLIDAQAGTLTPTGPANYSGPASFNINMNWANGAGNAAVAIQFNWSAPAGMNATAITLPATVAANKSMQCSGTFPQSSGTCLIFGLNSTPLPVGPVTVLAATPTGNVAITVNTSAVLAADAGGLALASTGGSLTIPFVPPVSKCDLNASGAIDVNDLTIAAQRILASPQTQPCNFAGGTGMCNLFDLMVIWKAALGGACTAP